MGGKNARQKYENLNFDKNIDNYYDYILVLLIINFSKCIYTITILNTWKSQLHIQLQK